MSISPQRQVDTDLSRANLQRRPEVALRRVYHRVTVAIGSAPYALQVHERPDLHHETGQWKFLETPWLARKAEVVKAVGDEIKGGLN